jgi:hypothetical protein
LHMFAAVIQLNVSNIKRHIPVYNLEKSGWSISQYFIENNYDPSSYYCISWELFKADKYFRATMTMERLSG